MKFGQLQSTRESMGQDDVTDLSMVETQQAQEEAIESASALGDTEALADNIAQGTEIIDESMGHVEEAQIALGGDDASGPATPLEVATTESLIQSIHRTLGTERLARPTQESNGHILRSSLVATLEAEKEGLLQKAIAGGKALINTVIQFFKNLFMSKKGLERYIDGLIAQARQAGNFDGGGQVPAKFFEAGDASEALDVASKLIQMTNRGVESHKNIEEMIAKLDPANPSDEEGGAIALAMLSPLDSGVTEKHLGGGKMLDAKYKLVNTPNPPTQGERLNGRECMALLQKARKVLSDLMSMKKVENRLIALIKSAWDVTAMGAGAASLPFRGEEGKKAMTNKAGIRMARLVARELAQVFGGRFPGIVFKTVKWTADYVKASLPTASAAVSE